MTFKETLMFFNLSEDCPVDDVEKVRKKYAKEYHPDKSSKEDKQKNEEILKK